MGNKYTFTEYRTGLICHGTDFGGRVERLRILPDGTELWKKHGASYAYPRSAGTGYSAVQYWHVKLLDRRVNEDRGFTDYDVELVKRVDASSKKTLFIELGYKQPSSLS